MPIKQSTRLNNIRRFIDTENRLKGSPIDMLAKELGVNLRTIYKVRSSQLYKDLTLPNQPKTQEIVSKVCSVNREALDTVLEDNKKEVTKAMSTLIKQIPFAVKSLIKIAKTGTSTDRIRFDACKEILDRSGLKPPDVIETRERAYTPEEIIAAKNALEEIASTKERLTNQKSRFLLSRTDTMVVETTREAVTDENSGIQPEETP